MIDIDTSVKVKTNEGVFDFGKIRSVNFTVMAVGKSINISIYNDSIDYEKVCGIIRAVGKGSVTISLVNSSGQDDYDVNLGGVNFSVGYLEFGGGFA